MKALPLFPVTTVGSWPRSQRLLDALARKRRNQLLHREFNALADEEVLAALRIQERLGVDLVTDGELRRDNFYSFVAEKLDGIRLMSLAEMLDIVEDKEGFSALLATLDVPAYSIRNPTCVGRIARREPLVTADYAFLRGHTDRPIKVTLPGPYLLTRAMWVKEVTRDVYATTEDLAEDVVGILRDEVEALRDLGAAFIQLDEPVLTELVFTQGKTRTFMCAALAARKDPAEELSFAVGLINRVTEGLTGVTLGVHVCRGNWSQNEATLLRGSYRPLAPWFARMRVDQLVLEYATPRAGDFVAIPDKSIGLGVVNPRTPAIETPEEIQSRVLSALRHAPADRIFLNPDCGFGTFANRPMSTAAVATAKLANMVAAARALRSHLP